MIVIYAKFLPYVIDTHRKHSLNFYNLIKQSGEYILCGILTMEIKLSYSIYNKIPFYFIQEICKANAINLYKYKLI